MCASQEHSARDRNYPKWITHKKAIKIAAIKNFSIKEATQTMQNYYKEIDNDIQYDAAFPLLRSPRSNKNQERNTISEVTTILIESNSNKILKKKFAATPSYNFPQVNRFSDSKNKSPVYEHP